MVTRNKKHVETKRVNDQEVYGGDGASVMDASSRKARGDKNIKEAIRRLTLSKNQQLEETVCCTDKAVSPEQPAKLATEPAPEYQDDSWGTSKHEELIQRMVAWLKLFVEPDGVVELRGLEVINRPGRRPCTMSGFFDREHLNVMAEEAIGMTQTSKGVYFTLNPLNSALLSRRYNRVDEADDGASDKDVLRRRWLLIDVDPKRVAGVSASEREKTLAKEKIEAVRSFLTKQSWPMPVFADSGNGYHLLYRVDLPADDGELVKRVLQALAAKFNTPAVQVDTSVFNPARIVKLYGTLARKGDSTKERPHRWASILEVPSNLQMVPLERLQALGVTSETPAPKKEASTSSTGLEASSSVLERAKAYLLNRVPGGISGDHGHDKTFYAACVLRKGFNLPAEQALPIMKEWNDKKCQPSWDEKDLLHKLEDAGEKGGRAGYLLGRGNNKPERVCTFKAKFMDSSSLDRDVEEHRWLVKHVLVANQPMMVGGRKKTLKTSVVLDLALSLVSGKPFLGKFEVPTPLKVLVLSGESGKATLRDTARRICRVKEMDFATCGLKWGFELPQLSNPLDLAELTAGLVENGIEVVIIDPLYLCLTAGSDGLQTSNMFEVGPLLLNVAQACLDAGTTPILVHHARKANQNIKGWRNEPLDLEDLAYAGMAEFARQWMIISRFKDYDPETGEHQLFLNIGGSAGHSGMYGLNVTEGKLKDDFGGRDWFVRVVPPDELKKEVKKVQDEKKLDKQYKQDQQEQAAIIKALKRYPDGETKSAIADAAHIDRRRIESVLEPMLPDLTVCRIKLAKGFGGNSKSHDGWKLYHEPGTPWPGADPELEKLLKQGVALQEAEAAIQKKADAETNVSSDPKTKGVSCQ